MQYSSPAHFVWRSHGSVGTPSWASAIAREELAGVVAAGELGVAADGGMAGVAGAIAAGELGVAADGGVPGSEGAAPPAAAVLAELLLFAAGASDPLAALADVGVADAAGCDGEPAGEAAFGFEPASHPIATTRQRLDTVNVNLLDMSHLEVSLGQCKS